MTHVMCSPWKKTFTLMPLALLTMFSPFIDDIVLLVVKGLLFLSMVESIWMSRFGLWKDPQVVFASCKTLIENILYLL
jgi:hypothetical protein